MTKSVKDVKSVKTEKPAGKKNQSQEVKYYIDKPSFSTKNRKRVGRGGGSKKGGTAGAGHKGYLSRSGVSDLLVFEGGQIPLVRKMPKFGFSNAPFKKDFQTVQLGRINEKYDAGEEVNTNTLKTKGLIGSRHKLVKIVGGGELKKAVTVAKGIAVTKSVEKALADSGSTLNK